MKATIEIIFKISMCLVGISGAYGLYSSWKDYINRKETIMYFPVKFKTIIITEVHPIQNKLLQKNNYFVVYQDFDKLKGRIVYANSVQKIRDSVTVYKEVSLLDLDFTR